MDLDNISHHDHPSIQWLVPVQEFGSAQQEDDPMGVTGEAASGSGAAPEPMAAGSPPKASFFLEGGRKNNKLRMEWLVGWNTVH